MKVSLRMYQLPIMISPFVSFLQRRITYFNHCAIQLDDIVIHDFDDYKLPRWISEEADIKLFNVPKMVIQIGNSNLTYQDIQNYTNNLPRMSRFNELSRHIWYYTAGLWPKRNDCVHKVSLTLNYIFNTPVVYSTPDKLIEVVNDYR